MSYLYLKMCKALELCRFYCNGCNLFTGYLFIKESIAPYSIHARIFTSVKRGDQFFIEITCSVKISYFLRIEHILIVA